MPIPKELLPELQEWKGGSSVPAEDWIWMTGRADHALGYCSLLWPDFVVFEGYVLRVPTDIDRLRGWENGGRSRSQVETAMNVFFLENAFSDERKDGGLYDAQMTHLAAMMVDMLDAKLRRDFPDKSFSAFVIDEDEDFGVSFHQI